MPIEGWFHTPIYFNMVNSEREPIINAELKDCLEKINFSKNSGWGNQNHSLSDPNFSGNLFEQFKLPTFENEISIHITEYLKSFNTQNLKFKIVTSWLTKSEPKEYTTVHNHGNSDISGVYYYQTNTKDGSLYFMNPNLGLTTSIFLKTDEIVSYPPQVGKIILFPGWLSHGVRSNDTEDVRISFSFNVVIEK